VAALLDYLNVKPRLFYGWVIIVALGVTITVSYGALYYSMGVFLAPLRDDSGWSSSAISGAFSVAILFSGLAGIVVGRLTDRYGSRLVMSVGSVLGALGLAMFSMAHEIWQIYFAWGLVIGCASAASFYPPAFTAVTAWFERKTGRALGLLTFLGGFASIIFIPLTSQLIDEFGWRTAARLLALVILLIAFPLHAAVLRRRPADLGLTPDGRVEVKPETNKGVVRERTDAHNGSASGEGIFWVITASFFCASFATTTVFVHQIPHLVDSGFSATDVATAAGLIGVASLPGRFVLSSLTEKVDAAVITCGVLVLMGLSLAVLIFAASLLVVYAYVLLFGVGFGAITPLRGAIMADHFGRAGYGKTLGMQGAVLAVAAAGGPLAAGAMRDASGSYETAFLLMAALYFAAAGLISLTALMPGARAAQASVET